MPVRIMKKITVGTPIATTHFIILCNIVANSCELVGAVNGSGAARTPLYIKRKAVISIPNVLLFGKCLWIAYPHTKKPLFFLRILFCAGWCGGMALERFKKGFKCDCQGPCADRHRNANNRPGEGFFRFFKLARVATGGYK